MYQCHILAVIIIIVPAFFLVKILRIISWYLKYISNTRVLIFGGRWSVQLFPAYINHRMPRLRQQGRCVALYNYAAWHLITVKSPARLLHAQPVTVICEGRKGEEESRKKLLKELLSKAKPHDTIFQSRRSRAKGAVSSSLLTSHQLRGNIAWFKNTLKHLN